MEMKYIIRKANEGDLDKLAYLAHSWVSEFDIDHDLNGIREQIISQMNDGVIFIALVDNQIIGVLAARCVFFAWRNLKAVEEDFFYVFKQARGFGVGADLIRHLEDFAKENNIKTVLFNMMAFKSRSPDESKHMIENFGYSVQGHILKKDL